MWRSQDRLLTTMFVFQFVVAVAFGAVLLALLADDPVSDGGDDTDVAASQVAPGLGAASEQADDGARPAGATPGPGEPADAVSGPGDGTATDPGADPDAEAGGDDRPTPDPSGPPPATGPTAPVDGTRTGITDDTIRIGVLVTQTGAINFRSSAQATRAYVDMLNEGGGIHGRRVEVVLRDDGLDENRGRAAVEQMIDDGVFAFVAFNAPLTEQSILPLLDKHGLPLIGAFAITSHPLAYAFSAPYETYGVVGGETLGTQPDVTTPGLVFLSNQKEAADTTIIDSYRMGLEKAGLELDDDNVFAVDVTKASYDDVATSLRFNGVDGIATVLDATAMVRLQQSLNRQAYRPVHVASPFGGDPEVIANPNVGDSFEGTLVLSDVDFLGSGSPSVQRHEAEVRRRFGRDAELNWAGQHGWLGVKLFADVMDRLGPDPTREALVEQMDGLRDFETGLTPPITITSDPKTHNTNNHCLKVGKVVAGKVEQVRDWQCPPPVFYTL